MSKKSIPENLVAYCKAQIGCSYSQQNRFGKNPNVFDCSSLVYRGMEQQGYKMTSSVSTYEVYDKGFKLLYPTKESDLGKKLTSIAAQRKAGYTPMAGDVVYINTIANTPRKNKITHVVVVCDDKSIVHARGTAYGVRMDSIDLYGSKIVAITRFKAQEPESPKPGLPREVKVTGVTTTLSLRKEPDATTTVLYKLPPNSRLWGLEAKSGWVRCVHDTGAKYLEGWCSEEYLT